VSHGHDFLEDLMNLKKKNGFRTTLFGLQILVAAVCFPGILWGTQTFEATMGKAVNQKWTGDFDAMVKRQYIRILVPYSKTFYFIDKGAQRGASYEIVKAFEKKINKELKTRHLKFHAIFIPTSRDILIQGLVDGLGDIAVGNLTITDDRLKQVDFCDPMGTGVAEILVTSVSAPKVTNLADLAGREIHVRKSSSYYESLVNANKHLKKKGKAAIKIVQANENFEDEDLLEMVNANLIPMTLIDSHKGEFWTQIFENIRLYPEIKFREDGRIAWAVRKNSPELKTVINQFVKNNKKGTLMGNMIFNRYLKDTRYVKNNLAGEDRERFKAAGPFFQKYAAMYAFDSLMIAALAYQESTIDQSKKSHVGAVGVMQILPSTAKDKNVGIPGIDKIEPNIQAGTKYLRFIADRYFNDPAINPLNQMLFSFAAYNAGPAKISKLRKEAASLNLDPNVWFKNVEIIAAKRIGRETVQYVSNIFKYYIAYTYSFEQEKKRKNDTKS
jgi:membrane-bound lytic murein transglycosylase MltF